MQNSGKFFTFLFSHSSKSNIRIRRVEVSKKLLQNTLLGLALIIGVTSFGAGIFGVFNFDLSQASLLAATLENQTLTQLSLKPTKVQAIDYSRPEVPDIYARNSGGPLSLADMDPEDAEIEKQLRSIQATSNHASIPAMWAHMGKINNEFGFRRNPFGGRTYEFHAGMDIDGERGDQVVAPANGVVTEAGWKGGYGNMIEIDHGNGLKTRYGHLSKIDVNVGDSISRGQIMAYVGSTGRSTGPHLHYELRLNDRPINPRRFLPPEATELKKVG
ncbi:MAG TPA: M23 family metallopeptidase [Pyrinomonadaceae bacterium]|jgi:murein DD-endopeptidase MepM/ murein hydrolase activator NlpD|nr:M23 family metallopeptidase [Pyrinomonadaceae bacterium]